MAPPAPPAIPRRVLRHHWLVRASHAGGALAIIFLLMTGLNILSAHPRLYWGDAGSAVQDEGLWLEIGVAGPARAPRGWLEVAGTRIDTTGLLGVSTGRDGRPAIVAVPHWASFPGWRDLGTARTWHFFMAWVLAASGLAWLGHGLASGHIRRDLFGHGQYKRAQRSAYAGITLLVLPVLVLTGMAMSPGLDAALPWLDALWGGRQSARSLHFIAAIAIGLFLAGHLVMVLASGPFRLVASMVTGRVVEGR